MMIAVHVLQYLIIPQYKSLPSNVSSTEMLTTLLQVSWCHVMAVSRNTHNRFTALWNLSGKTRVSRYQKNIHPLLSS